MSASRAGVLVALFLGALALRPQLVGVGPLLPEIQDDLAVSHALAGLLGTIPVLCMGLFAPPAPILSGRLGSRYAVAACLAAIAVFGLVRAVAPGAPLVLLLTFPIGVGMGFAGALLPVAVKERFADRPAFATGVYATGISLGSAISSAIAVPVADASGGWRGTLLAFSSVTVGLVVVWLVLTRRSPGRPSSRAELPRLPFRVGLAWALVAVFGLESMVFYGLNSWMPDSYVERGWSEESAGALIAVLNATVLPASLLVPWAADRAGSRRLYLTGASALLVGALLGVVLLPAGGWLWAALAGAAIGVLFPLSLTLPLDVAERPAQVGAFAGLMLGAGYSLSALSPFTLGAVRDASGSFTASLWLLVAVALALLLACLPLSGERLRRHIEPTEVAG